MTRPFRSFGNDMRSVLLATIAFGIVVGWALIMFGVPASLVQTDPSREWFIGMTVICAVAALATARFKWATIVALHAAAGFATICAHALVTRCKDLEHTYPLLPYTWRTAVFVALCGLAPVCLLIGITNTRLGLRRPWSIGIALALWTAPVWVFASANVVDYLSFRSTLRRVQGLTPAQLAAMAQRVREPGKSLRYADGDWPMEFAPLHPKEVHVTPGYSYVPLYQRGEIYLEFAVETAEGRQFAYFFTNCDGPQKEVNLWSSRPATPAIGPQPLVTLHQYAMHWFRDWIVLPDRILVIGTKDDDPRAKDTLLAESALSPADYERLAGIVADTKSRIGGRAFMAPVDDGLAVLIHFGPVDGPAPDDILLHNAWTDQARPLFAAVCDRLPAEFRSDFARRIAADEREWPRPVRVRHISEIRDEHPRPPWWCAWPDLLRPDSGYVIGDRVGTSHIPDPFRYIYRD